MTTIQLCIFAGSMLLAFLIGTVFAIIQFGGDPPVGTLKIHYGQPEEDPYIFLELWEGAGDITKKSTVNLVVSATADENYIARK